MNGTVNRLRPRGVEATMDGDTSGLNDTDKFQIYRVVNNVEVVVGNFYAKRSKGENLICLNFVGNGPGSPGMPNDPPTVLPQVGDLVRSV